MRATPPKSLRLDAADLLRDVRDRLAEHHPQLAASLDPTHPAWILLQESAWMVETLSGQLDRYPWAVLQQFAHLLGAHLRPAHPAVAALVVDPEVDGRLTLQGDPSRWRFFAPRTEQRGLVGFELAESEVPVRSARVVQLCAIRDGELFRASGPRLDALDARPGPLERSAAFASEYLEWTVLASAGERLESVFAEAIARLRTERGIGWLALEARADGDAVRLVARVDVAGAFAGQPPLTAGGDVVGRWAALDDSTWTPPVRIADHPLLPRAWRGNRPLAGENPGEILVPDVPAGVRTADLLVRDARPAPAELADAVWATLAHLDTRLAPLRPTLVRGVRPSADEPAWVDGALRHHAWARIVDRASHAIAEVAFRSPGGAARVGWLGEPGRLRAFAVHPKHGVEREPLPLRRAWTDRFASASGAPVRTTAWDLDLPADVARVLLVADGGDGALVNPVLVINAPLVRDGRRVTVARAIPEPVHLLHPDVVDRASLRALARLGLDPSVAALLERLPLASVEREDGSSIPDFQGIQLDPTEGTAVLNAPDAEGSLARFRRGEVAHFAWYRRTDAEVGNVGPGEIRLVEQAPTVQPRLAGAHNPLGAVHGSARESDEAVVDRVFGPPVAMPVTAADWERLIRQALGPRAQGWVVRVWGYAERSLVSTALWPPPAAGTEPESVALAAALKSAGPQTLLVALGPSDATLDADGLSWARRVVEGVVAEWAARVPTITAALVTPLWPLVLTTDEDGPPTPAFGIRGVRGALADRAGRSAHVPLATFLLNAAVVEVRRGA